MYCPDTLQRLNQEAVDKYVADQFAQNMALKKNADPEDLEIELCDYCSKPSTHAIPVYNPADAVRDVEGAYSMAHVCDDHYEDGTYMEERFYCEGCGELFVDHHSWDSLITIINDGFYCQACAIEEMNPVPLWEILESDDFNDWVRISAMPGHELLWEGEYSDYSDFPGNTTLGQVKEGIAAAMKEKDLNDLVMVYPLVTQTYQFSVVLAVYLSN
jgi:hypothetical protein